MLNPDNKQLDVLAKNEQSLSEEYDVYIDQVVLLQKKLEIEKDKRKEERFVFVVLLLFLLDGYVLKGISWISQLLILAFQFAILFYYANVCGVERVIKWFFIICEHAKNLLQKK